jgi:hypothetical protein
MSIETRLRAELRAWADELDPDAGPEVTAASLTDLHHRRLRHRAALLATAVVAVLVAVTVPFVLGHRDDRSAPSAPSLYDLPTRGPLAHDEAFLGAAVQLPWEQIDPPVETRHVVWAGDVPGGERWVLVAGENTAVPADTDPEHQTDLGALSSTALALFTGPAGASADRLSPANVPHGQTADEPFAVQDAATGTLLVVAAPGDAIEVSDRPVFEADGTESRSWQDSAGRDGVALVELPPLLANGPTPVAYQVFRDRLEVGAGIGPEVFGAAQASDLVLATVHGPLLAADDAQQAAGQLVAQLGVDRGEPDALVPWQGHVPGPAGDGGAPATVTVAAVTAPSGAVLVDVWWSRALEDPLVNGAYGGVCVVRAVLPDGWPAAERTYAFSCDVFGSSDGVQTATSFVIAAPPEAVHARLYGAGGDVVAEVDLTDGVAVLPETETLGQRPAVAVEAFAADGTTLPRSPVLTG